MTIKQAKAIKKEIDAHIIEAIKKTILVFNASMQIPITIEELDMENFTLNIRREIWDCLEASTEE